MVSFAFYGFLIYYLYHTDLKKPLKYSLMALLGFIILLIGLSRIYLGVHYASDVIGGFLLAFIYLVIYIKFIYKREKKANK